MNQSTIDQKLELIKDVKRFCTEELGIKKNDSFTKFANREFDHYNVYVINKDSFKSVITSNNSLLDAGHIVCENEESFQSTIKQYLGRKDVDIAASTIIASVNINDLSGSDTLITNYLLNSPSHEIVDTVIHENIHLHFNDQKVIIHRGIEEPIAYILAYQGSKQYYRNNYIHTRDIIRLINKEQLHTYRFNRWCDKYYWKLYLTHNPDDAKAILLEANTDNKLYGFVSENALNSALFVERHTISAFYSRVNNILRRNDPAGYLKKIGKDKEIFYLRELKQILRN
jgi:hypothetical protein